MSYFINCYYLGLGERILREEKEMRDMKSRLFAIEAELQTLYRETGDESEVCTKRTVTESVMRQDNA